MSQRPQVTIFPEWYPTASDPVAGTFVREQARAAAAHAEVAVVHVDRGEPPRRGLLTLHEERDGDLRVVRAAVGHNARGRGLSTALRVATLAAGMRRLERGGHRTDVLHAHVFSAGAAALAVGAARRVPVVVSEHYSAVARGRLSAWDRAVARSVYARARVTCPVSRDLGRAIRALAPAATIEQVPNVVDVSLFHPAAQPRDADPSEAPRLIAVGMLTEIKGIGHLIDALPTVRERHPGVSLEVVGDGPELAGLRARAARAGVEPAVAFLGRRTRPEVADVMRGADVLVLPSLWENLPCVVIEALATGLPVVGTRVGGVPELLDDRCGVLVEPGSSDALADGIAAVVADLRRWDRRSVAAAARERYGFDAVGSRWARVYAEARRERAAITAS